MNYKDVYIKIIKNAKKEQTLGIRSKKAGYYEKHHILPKSLFPRWTNRKSNIVLLTAREHFFCHQLLIKIYPGQAMACALHAFTSRPNADYKISSKEYQRIKENYSIEVSKRFKGKKRPKEVIDKIKKTRSTRTYIINVETRKKIGSASKGRQRSLESRKKQSESLKGHANWAGDSLIEGAKKFRENNPELVREMAKNASLAAREINTIKIVCWETNNIFNSITEANNDMFNGQLNISPLDNKGRSVGGYHFFSYDFVLSHSSDDINNIIKNRKSNGGITLRCIETGKIYKSKRQLAQELNTTIDKINRYLLGKETSINGYTIEKIY